MRRFGWLTLAALAGTLLGAGLTARLPLGAPLWHHNAAFALVLLAAIAGWRLLARRRFATTIMAYSGILATATGFVMLYSKELPLKDVVTWWHTVTSFALTLGFLAHWWHNQARLAGFTRRLFGRLQVGGPATGAWAMGLTVGALTWTPAWRARFTGDNYLYLSSWAVLTGVALAYGLWLWHRLPARRARLADPHYRSTARALVDTSLFAACWLALLTGFALLYFADFLRSGDMKYVSKWWHTATSVAFLALVAIHVGFNIRPLAAHAKRIDKDLR